MQRCHKVTKGKDNDCIPCVCCYSCKRENIFLSVMSFLQNNISTNYSIHSRLWIKPFPIFSSSCTLYSASLFFYLTTNKVVHYAVISALIEWRILGAKDVVIFSLLHMVRMHLYSIASISIGWQKIDMSPMGLAVLRTTSL